MALSMAEIRAKLKAKEEESTKTTTYNSNEPQAFLAHWNLPEGIPLNLRFLPDANPENDFFWKERDMINLTFSGIKGGEQKPVRITVPCNEMWGPVNSCPVLKEVREWYKQNDPALEERARVYWKKKSYLFQLFIAPNSAPVEGDVAPENPIRRVLLNKPLFNKVKSILLDPDMENLPTDFTGGVDFSIIKGKQGNFASYDQSTWKRNSRALNADELAAIEKYGLEDLNDFMPKQPNEAELQAIAEMFEASVNGEQYDPARWAFAYRPQGVQKPTGDNTPTASAPTQAQPAPQVAQTTQVSSAAAALSALTSTASTQTETVTAQQPAAPAVGTDTASLLAKLAKRA